jgi:hypothetical protein
MSHGGGIFASIVSLANAINQLGAANNEPFALRFTIDGHVSADQQGA